MFIYIEREREIYRERYIYIYRERYIYIYICIYEHTNLSWILNSEVKTICVQPLDPVTSYMTTVHGRRRTTTDDDGRQRTTTDDDRQWTTDDDGRTTDDDDVSNCFYGSHWLKKNLWVFHESHRKSSNVRFFF